MTASIQKYNRNCTLKSQEGRNLGFHSTQQIVLVVMVIHDCKWSPKQQAVLVDFHDISSPENADNIVEDSLIPWREIGRKIILKFLRPQLAVNG